MKRFIAFLAAVLLICVSVLPHITASADGLTASMVAGMSYAMANSWGISFTSANATSAGMESFMTGQVESYVNSHGGSLTALFGTETARLAGGKLAAGYQLYNGIKDFVSWMSTAYNLSASDFSLTQGVYNGKNVPYKTGMNSQNTAEGLGGYSYVWSSPVTINGGTYYGVIQLYKPDGTSAGTKAPASNNKFDGNTRTQTSRIGNNWYLQEVATQVYANGQLASQTAILQSFNLGSQGLENRLSWNGTDYSVPTVLNPDKEWTGTLGGTNVPDTNLEQLLDRVFEDVAGNSLDVTGELVDTAPAPTPVPTYPPFEGNDIPSLGEYMQQGLENIDTNLGELTGTLEGVNDGIGDIQGTLEGVNEGIGELQGTLEGVNEGIGTLTESLEGVQEGVDSLTGTITDALDVPASDEIDDYKFDLKTLFPFCIPWDIYAVMNCFNASPVTPYIEIPFEVPSIDLDYTIVLDFADWDGVAQICRNVEFAAFLVALCVLTGKVIRW